jgi:putative phosphoesterase
VGSSVSRIGVISDTHGVVHPAVADVFANVDAIVHAGDIGGVHVVDALRAIAPVMSVEGNNDRGATGEAIVRVTLGGLRILITHILPRPHQPAKRVVASLRENEADVVVFGHSHLPHNEIVDGVRYFNPASAGPRRFDYPVSVGLFEKNSGAWSATHLALDERSVDALQRRMNQMS